MPFILIKNNLKLMLRSKWFLFMMIILPLITIELLSNAFREMMSSAYNIKEFRVGYRISEDSNYNDMLIKLETECKKKNIILQEYPEGDIEKLLKGESVAVFVDIKDDHSYVIYQSNDRKTQAAVTESIFSGFFYQINSTMTALSYGKEHGINAESTLKSAEVVHETLDADPVPSSTDYYGIIYIVYFAWCGLVSLVAVISSERKSAIPKRMLVSHMPKWKYYMGKYIPCALATFIEVSAAWILSILLFDIHWGNVWTSAFIILLISLAASAYGIVLFQMFHNVAVSIVAAFVTIWVAGFFGGSFQPYMYAHLPKLFVNMSPLYFINRTLIEFSTKGHSAYTGICISFLIGLIVVFGVIGILLMNREMGDQE